MPLVAGPNAPQWPILAQSWILTTTVRPPLGERTVEGPGLMATLTGLDSPWFAGRRKAIAGERARAVEVVIFQLGENGI